MPFEPPPLRVPSKPAENRILDGAHGQRWLESLPARVDDWCRRWGLTRDAVPPRHGFNALVVAVRRSGEPCVLKISWRDTDPADEVAALRAWKGLGTVQLLEWDESGDVLLLERLHADRSLSEVDLEFAASIAGSLIRTLAIPAPPGFPLLTRAAAEVAATIAARDAALGYPVPGVWVRRAVDIARGLATSTATLLVHTDLHYGNVLSGDRQSWAAIDPRPAAGDPERSVAELLWTRLDEVPDCPGAAQRLLAVVVAAGRLDPEIARAWVIVRTLDYWLWGLKNGLTEDPIRCHRLLGAFLG